MSAFYDTILTFPALLFTSLLAVVLMYWLLVIFGALDMGGGADADVDVDADADVDVDTGDGFSIGNAVAAVGLSGVPISISFSLLTLAGWISSVPATYLLKLFIPGLLLQIFAGIVVFIFVMWLAILVTRVGIRPLRPMFHSAVSKTGDKLLGQVCVISTGRVDESFGQADYNDGGAGLILSVRADAPNSLHKGDKAVIVGYDDASSAYRVVPFDDVFD